MFVPLDEVSEYSSLSEPEYFRFIASPEKAVYLYHYVMNEIHSFNSEFLQMSVWNINLISYHLDIYWSL